MTYLRLLKRLSGNKQVHNFGFLFSIQASNILISVVTIPLVVGAIGVEQLGLVDLSLSIVYTLNIIVSYGYNLSAPREVAINFADKEELSKIFSRVLLSKLVLAGGVGLLLVLATQNLGEFNRNSTILLFSAAVLLAEALFPHWLAQGLEKMHILSIGNLVSKVTYLGLIFWLVKSPEESFLVNFLLGISGVGANSLLLVYIVKYWGISFKRVSFHEIWVSLTDNFYLFLSSIAGYISINSGIIILSFFVTDYMLGAYSLADRVVRVLRIVPTIVIQAIYPRASRLYVTDKQEFNSFLRKSYILALIACLLVSLAAFLFSPIIVEVLAREHLTESIKVLKILAFVPFFASLNIANMILVLVSDNRKVLVKGTWVSFCVMVVICVGLSYRYGALGLASGLLLTELLIFTVQFYFNLLSIRTDTLHFYSLNKVFKRGTDNE
ncbi:oligosaccharide flippase family protein [uncultured Imperialibacter sp.]|uniref:oligosaccharide flippase family protein n=1 Tax=uncultured Imperialibacter sp. TaxID=1672639 RepID=UPI0030D9AD34|tara:strand:+ start:3571 stop:4887 length:1317 start_codon:yes stop_codon:yes gene_type:complete